MQRTQRNPVDDASPEFWPGRKMAETHKALLWQLLNDDPSCPSRLVLHILLLGNWMSFTGIMNLVPSLAWSWVVLKIVFGSTGADRTDG